MKNTENNNYFCPECKFELVSEAGGLSCHSCNISYQLKDNIPIFTEKLEYWCNVDRSKMHQLIEDAETSKDWLGAVERHIPRYAAAVVPLYRADAQFIFNIDKSCRVLDAGSMWGGLTIPIAQFCKEIVALDKTWETLRFLKVRSEQMHMNNVIPVVSAIHKLPFPDNHFDYIVVNGVLEWLGMKEELVLEREWSGREKSEVNYTHDPRQMQLAALKELRRVLKAGGGIYVAIENRLGLQYFCGHPDDHANVHFVTFLPRKLANFFTKLVRNSEYRTYVYTPNQLNKIVREAGFANTKLYSVYPHYGKISRLTPFNSFAQLKTKATEGYWHIKVFVLSLLWRLLPEPLCKHFSPSLAITASNSDEYTHKPRLLALLRGQDLIAADKLDQYELLVFNNRFDDVNTVNYLVLDKGVNELKYFIKISRQRNSVNLIFESAALQEVNCYLAATPLADSVPQVVYAGETDGLTIQVTQFMRGRAADAKFLNGLRRIEKIISMRHKLVQSFTLPLRTLGRALWLKRVNSVMIKALDWLADFQKYTKTADFRWNNDAKHWLEDIKNRLQQNGFDLSSLDVQLNSFLESMRAHHDLSIPLALQHGDFDLCNVMLDDSKIRIVDFEHLEKNTLPFFDFGNLIFSPFLTEWRDNPNGLSLIEYAKISGWLPYLKRWSEHYATKTGLSSSLLALAPTFMVLEQNAKQYPSGRNPHDYPVYGEDALRNMIGWEL